MVVLGQAPAANHKDSVETMAETFALTNISPQVRACYHEGNSWCTPLGVLILGFGA